MPIIIFSSIVVVVFYLYDAIPMYLNEKWRQFWVYTAMMMIILLLIFLKHLLNVSIPSPSEPIKGIIIYIFGEQ